MHFDSVKSILEICWLRNSHYCRLRIREVDDDFVLGRTSRGNKETEKVADRRNNGNTQRYAERNRRKPFRYYQQEVTSSVQKPLTVLKLLKALVLTFDQHRSYKSCDRYSFVFHCCGDNLKTHNILQFYGIFTNCHS